MASKRFSRLFKILASAVADADEIFQLEGRLERFVHFWALVTRQFMRYRCFVRASALSFSTLLALIPLLAVALNVTSNFLSPQREASLTQFVENVVSRLAPSVELSTNSQPNSSQSGAAATNAALVQSPATNAVVGTNTFVAVPASNAPPVAVAVSVSVATSNNIQKQVAQQIHGLVQTASSGTLGATGLIFFIITAISLLRGIEETFNDMWGVTRGRSWRLQFLLYWAIISLGPVLLAAALGFAGKSYFQHTRQILESSEFLRPVYGQVVPIAILSFTLTFIYKLTPNTKVELPAAMLGGLVAGAAWHIYNQIGFLLASRALNASKFYGGLALVVLVMGGLYILWLIILFGAQIAYAYQNRGAYLQDRLAENVNQRGREFVALRIMTCLGQRFQQGLRPATVPEISVELGLPSRLTQSVLRTLVATRLVSELAGAEAAFVPARPLDAINAYDILIAMRTGTGQELPLSDAPELSDIYGEFARIEQAERAAAAGVSLLTLAARIAPSCVLPPPKPISAEIKPASPEPNVISSQAGTLPSAIGTEPATAASNPPESGAGVDPDVEEASKPPPFPEKTEPAVPPETPPVPDAPAEPERPPRREPARPDENTDFPL